MQKKSCKEWNKNTKIILNVKKKKLKIFIETSAGVQGIKCFLSAK